MKNPFNEPARESWFCGTWDLSDREFCAHAINQHDKLVAERDKLALANLMQRHGWTVLVNALKDGKSYSVIAAECRNDKDIGCYCGCHISTVMAEEKPLRSNLPPQHSEI